MKRFFVIIFIILLLSGITIMEEMLLKNTVDNIDSKATVILSLIDENLDDINTDKINIAIKNFEDFWRDEERKLCYFTSYDKIKSVNESIKKLNYATKNNDISLAIENVATIQTYTHFLHYIMGFNLNNLF